MRGYIPSILFAGDSITVGLSPFLIEQAPRLFGKIRGFVYAKTSTGTRDWFEGRWLSQIARKVRPNIVVIALGTNIQERDEYEYAGRIRLLCDEAQAGGAAFTLVVGPFAEDADGRRNFAVRWSVAPMGVINGYDLARGLPRAGEGGVHFTSDGYRQLADRLLRRIGPVVVRTQRPGGSITAAWITTLGGSLVVWEGAYWIPVMLPFVPP